MQKKWDMKLYMVEYKHEIYGAVENVFPRRGNFSFWSTTLGQNGIICRQLYLWKIDILA